MKHIVYYRYRNILLKKIKQNERGRENMETKTWFNVADITREMQVSKSTAYKIIKTLNSELAAKGMIIVAGKVPRRYYEERLGII